ncbi:NUDIX domain-containing protein [Bradyrhizobium sp. STM 3809]|uniref:NUDIX hydrolase n=1 Tax=Bradyrhizobium sp. STM 3809 TaxID=551936 RepID=UPI0003095D6D|nr:NUDIX domain-containing protein [Bradyrhizobium sp. STM 3809]
MTRWRPQQSIRVTALGLHWRAGCLLAAEVRDDAGRLMGVRPLGGGVEFGERWQDALLREFQEELGVAITLRGEPLILENIYRHADMVGHEIVFVVDIDVEGDPFADRDSIAFHEDSGMACHARWFDLADLDREDGPKLYPAGLKALLIARPKARSVGSSRGGREL